MSTAVSLGDIENEAIRQLAGYRSLSKAGLAVNATTNTYRIALGGTVQANDILTVSVSVAGAAAVSAEYTVVGNEANVGAIATAAELLVEALTGVASAVASTTNIDVTPATTTDAIVVTATVTKATGTPTLTATVSETIIGAKGIKTANTTLFTIDGHAGSQAATNNIALTGATIPAESFKWWLVSVNTSGTFTATPGTNGKNILPDVPSGQAVVGALKVATAAATTFIPGTTGLNATGITDTYYDLSVVPTAGYPA